MLFLLLQLKDQTAWNGLKKFIGEIDKISIVRYPGKTKSDEYSSKTKIHFQNFMRPSPTLFIRHWNDEKLEDMKVRTKMM